MIPYISYITEKITETYKWVLYISDNTIDMFKCQVSVLYNTSVKWVNCFYLDNESLHYINLTYYALYIWQRRRGLIFKSFFSICTGKWQIQYSSWDEQVLITDFQTISDYLEALQIWRARYIKIDGFRGFTKTIPLNKLIDDNIKSNICTNKFKAV